MIQVIELGWERLSVTNSNLKKNLGKDLLDKFINVLI